MNKILNDIKVYLILFFTGAIIYMFIELMYDGNTHWAMGILGGLSLILIGIINEYKKVNIFAQMFCGAIIITILELITGLLINQNYEIWDYRDLPYNFQGQICLMFSCIWFGLSFVAIKLDDFLRDIFE